MMKVLLQTSEITYSLSLVSVTMDRKTLLKICFPHGRHNKQEKQKTLFHSLQDEETLQPEADKMSYHTW